MGQKKHFVLTKRGLCESWTHLIYVQVNHIQLPIGFFCESCGFFLDENRLRDLDIPVNLKIKFAKKRDVPAKPSRERSSFITKQKRLASLRRCKELGKPLYFETSEQSSKFENRSRWK
jgi:hypothetical protein